MSDSQLAASSNRAIFAPAVSSRLQLESRVFGERERGRQRERACHQRFPDMPKAVKERNGIAAAVREALKGRSSLGLRLGVSRAMTTLRAHVVAPYLPACMK
jgi:hypothetical protein